MAGYPYATAGTTPTLYPTGSANPNYVTNGFVPEIWSGKLIEKFYAATVLSAISNTDYEGEIKGFGDRVKIRTKPTILINNYDINGLLSLDRPVGGNIELYVDQGKYWATILDDIIEKQSDINQLSMWADDASEQMKIAVDQDVLGFILNSGNSANMGSAAGAISGNINLGTVASPLAVVGRDPTTGQVEVLDVILRLAQCLDELNIPETGRWMVLPVWMTTQLKRSELRQVYMSGDQVSIIRNGRFGGVDRFTIYASNLLPAGAVGGLAAGEWVVYAGHAHALTFASQMTNVETLRSEMTFGQIFRGLQIYGRAVLDGKALAQAIVTQAGP